MNDANPPRLLSTVDHNTDVSGMTYVYPVVSRRMGGVSVGINLNPNNACNWHCIYCQVPNLTRGGPPPIDLGQLEAELRQLLHDIVHGHFMAEQVPDGLRVLKDIAFSGNGEPTSAAAFPDAVAVVGRVMADFNLIGKINVVLITNGSLIGQARVQKGLTALNALGGELWFKIDSALPAGSARINGLRQEPQRVMRRLATASRLCRTRIQTCVFAMDGQPPNATETEAYLGFLRRALADHLPLAGVLLYGLARPSLQAGAEHLSALPAAWLEAYAERIGALGLSVQVNP
jgi:wyosine [tRNA(Phe)-imidazoG37] synthetase (radical SAM superfamily)